MDLAPIVCQISWWSGPGWQDRAGSEAAVQALVGLMHLHGLDAGRPRRLGLEVASVAAGLIASQGVLAALVARGRGHPVGRVTTSVVRAALVLVSQYVARATGATSWGDWVPLEAGDSDGPGPPFPTAEGAWVELETLSTDAWRAFWTAAGVEPATTSRAWTAFGPRYSTGSCSLPGALSEATRRMSLEALTDLAAATGVSVCRLRAYGELSSEPELMAERYPAVRAGAAGAARPPTPGITGAPLHAVTVVEATSRVQGPLAGQLLRMLGARVIRVEPPGGDPARMVAPMAGATGAFFASVNRGKEGVELDLGDPRARNELIDLAARADVFLHNWRPGKDVEWGLDAERLSRANPALVFAGASGWGRAAASCPSLGMEYLVQARTALGEGLNPMGEAPFGSRLLLVDCLGGLILAEGILTGLWRRWATSKGQRVDTSLLAGAMALQAPVLEQLAAGQRTPGHGRPTWGVLDRPLLAADGYMVISADGPGRLDDLGRICGTPRLVPTGESVAESVASVLADRPIGDWEGLCVAHDIPCSGVTTDLAALARDPRVSGLFEPIGGQARAPRQPWDFYDR
ncbi:MAG: CoA transferase [Acidimicrobiales bacterium]